MFPREHVETDPEMTGLITSAEAARQLGYTVQHVRRMIREGLLEGRKMGRDWVVDQRSVLALIERRQNLALPLEADTE